MNTQLLVNPGQSSDKGNKQLNEDFYDAYLPNDSLTRKICWRTLNKIKYNGAITHNPMIPLWLDGAIENAVKTDNRLRYDAFSEFFFDLTHPNTVCMRRSAPLFESNPTLSWKITSGILFLANLGWLMVFIS